MDRLQSAVLRERTGHHRVQDVMVAHRYPKFAYRRSLAARLYPAVTSIFPIAFVDLLARSNSSLHRNGSIYGNSAPCAGLALRLLIEQECRRGVMLKITVDQAPEKITLKLEGSLSGAWVSELEDTWRAAALDRTMRPVCVDLASVVGMDAAG